MGGVANCHLPLRCILFPSYSHPIPSHHPTSVPASEHWYTVQDFGKNNCSKGTLVNTVAECRQAALEVKGNPNLANIESWPIFAKGCFTGSTNDYFHFNKHSTGGGHSSFSPVCKLKGMHIPRPTNADEHGITHLYLGATLTHVCSRSKRGV